MLLAIDLSTSHGSIAVLNDDAIVFEAAFQSERSHNAQVFAPLRDALTAAGDALTGIVIGNGPGSYTGVRIAIAAAQGIALSRGVWCIGWSSLTAPQIDAPTSYRVIGDARRQSFYLAQVENGRLLPELETVDANTARGRVAEGGPWLSFDAKVPLDPENVHLARPNAAQLARHVQRCTPEEIASLAAQPLTPHYLAEAFITTARKPGKAPVR
jgi:tRNA threonylcarbamoyladenosine biosynthesis protein TsaB